MSKKPRHPSSFMLPIAGPNSDPVWQPVADVYRTVTGWLVKFELAGVDPGDVEITVENTRLTVTGMRRDWTFEEVCSHYSMEIAYNRFERSLELPCNLERAHLDMEYRNGILLVRVTTKEE